MNFKLYRNYFLLFCLISPAILFNNCASIQAPSGGPRDTTSPYIEVYYPISKTTNFKEKIIRFEFSKYMNKTKVIENISIIPKVNLGYDWSGKELEIEFMEDLKENTTYALTIGADYVDHLGNKPQESFTMFFSTGDVIDSGKIEGKIIDDKTSGLFLFAYQIDNLNIDTLDITKHKPDYKLPIGTSGNFSLLALKPGKYRLLAIEDKFSDDVFDFGLDRIGIPKNDVVVSYDSASPNILIKMGSIIDTMPPKPVDVACINNRAIEVTFDEEVNTKTITPNSFFVIDTNGIEKNRFEFVSSTSKFSKKLLFYTKNDVTIAEKYYLKIGLPNEICDSLGNCMTMDTLQLAFYGDTTKILETPRIIFKNLKDSTTQLIPDNGIEFSVNIPIKLNWESIFKISKKGNSSALAFKVEEIYSGNWKINLEKGFDFGGSYNLELNTKFIEGINSINGTDTIYKYFLKFTDKPSLSIVKGKYENLTDCKSNLLISMIEKTNKKRFIALLSENNSIAFENVEAGNYRFECFCDTNGNGILDSGYPNPFVFGEEFYFLDKELLVKAKWDIEDLLLKIK